MPVRGDVHDPGWSALPQDIQEQVGEQEWCQMVDKESHLDAIGRLAAGVEKGPRVVHQNVKACILPLERGGELSNLLQIGKVRQEMAHAIIARLRANLPNDTLCLCLVPALYNRGVSPSFSLLILERCMNHESQPLTVCSFLIATLVVMIPILINEV